MNAEPATNGPAGPPPAPGWPATNNVSHPIPTGGKLLRGSNAWMLNGLGGQPDLFSAGRAVRAKMGSILETKLAAIRKKRTDEPNISAPLVGLGAGLGAVGLAHGFLSDEDTAKFQRFSDAAQTWGSGQNPRQAFREYVDTGAGGSSARPFGASMAKVMELGRKGIAGAAETLKELPITPEDKKARLDHISRVMHWSPTSGEHYEEFAKGPLSAYAKRIDEYMSGGAHRKVDKIQLAPIKPIITALRTGTPLPESAVSGQNIGSDVPAAQKSFEDLRQQLGYEKLNPAASSTSGYDSAASKLRAGITAYTVSQYGKNPWELDHKTQGQALARFDDWLKGQDKDLWAKKQVIDFSGGLHSAMGQTYSGAADKGLAVRKWLIGGGLAAAGISAGVLLYRLMKKKRDEEDRKDISSKVAADIQTKLAVITPGGTTGPMKNMKQGPQFVDWTKSDPRYAVAVRDPEAFDKEKDAMRRELAAKTASDLSLRVQCAMLEKLAKREPAPAEHPSAPTQQLRSRAEVIVADADGQIKAIDKGDYILFPGGGIDDGEHPEHTAVREVLEELGHNIVNLHQGPVVESLWPEDHPLSKNSPFKGERSHFFVAVDAGDAGMPHADLEPFKAEHPQTLINRLQQLMDDPKQAWAKANNKARLLMIGHAGSSAANGAPIKLAQAAAAPATPGVLPGVAPNPDQQFIAQLAAPLKQDNQGLPIRPATPGQSTTQLPPGVFHPSPTDIQSEANQTGLQTKQAREELQLQAYCEQLQKRAQLLPGDADSVDVSGGELTPGPVDFAQNVQADVHGQPQASKLIQFAQLDPVLKAPNAQQGETVDDQLQGQQMKTADSARLLPRKQFLLFTPDGKVIVRRLADRRFTLPEKGEGRPAPYEQPIRLIPEKGVPEAGYHGYELGLNVGQATDIPQGFEALPSQDVLNDLYAGMGLAKNKPFMQVDRSRGRAILRYLKKTVKPAVSAPELQTATSITPGA